MNRMKIVAAIMAVCLIAAVICSIAFAQAEIVSTAVAGNFAGAIYTTDGSANAVNQNHFENQSKVYLNGGPDKGELPDGVYYFQVTTSGGNLLSTDPAECRQLQVVGGKVMGAIGPECKHAGGFPDAVNGSIGVQLMPFNESQNGVYKVWLIRQYDESGNKIANVLSDGITIEFSESKTDNFHVGDCPDLAINCPPDIVVNCSEYFGEVNFGTATTTGGCGTITISYEDGEAISDCPLVFVRKWMASDDGGHRVSCNQQITINDDEAPEIKGGENVNIQCWDDRDSIPLPEVKDCDPTVGDPKYTDSEPVTEGCKKTFTRTYTAVDSCKNTSLFFQTITVYDTTPPVIKCPPNVDAECNKPEPDASEVEVSDNCDSKENIKVEYSDKDPLVDGCKMTIERTWKATDSCGNSSYCSQMINIEDKTAPVMTDMDPINVQCESEISAIDWDVVKTHASDNCGVKEVVSACPDARETDGCKVTITRYFKAIDYCGNESNVAKQIITVQDTTAPVIKISGKTNLIDWHDPCQKETSLCVSIIDNCEGELAPTEITRSDGLPVTYNNGKLITGPFPAGTTTVVVKAEDQCGNAAESKVDVTVNCVTPYTIGGTKYYDTNANGKYDDGEPVVEGFKIEVSCVYPDTTTEVISLFTDANGSWSTIVPEGTELTVCEVAPPKGWYQTGPISGTQIVYDNVVLAEAISVNGKTCWHGVMMTTPILELDFFNLCVVEPCGGYTKGFWGNKNGMAVLSKNDPGWRTLLNDLCLVKENGNPFDVALPVTTPPKDFAKEYSQLDEYLKKARAVNMAYMLSAQLTACKLDAAYMGLDSSYKLLLPRDLQTCIDPEWTGPFTIDEILTMANDELCVHPLAGAGTEWRSYQDCLKTIIDGINNNQWLFISKEQCMPVYPD